MDWNFWEGLRSPCSVRHRMINQSNKKVVICGSSLLCKLSHEMRKRNFLASKHKVSKLLKDMDSPTNSKSGAQPGEGGIWGICPPGIFKTLHSDFDICRNFQRLKMKFCILTILKKPYCNFSLSCSLIIISLQDLSWDRLSDRKFRKWLVFNHKYAGSVNLGDSLNCSYF